MDVTRQTHVSLLVVIRRERTLPSHGTITARINSKVQPADVIGRATLSPAHYLFDIAHGLNLTPSKADRFLKRQPGDNVSGGDILAGPVGWMRRVVRAPEEGKIILQGDGRLLFEGLGESYELRAGLPGTIIGMESDQSVTIETVGALVEGVWGNEKQEYGGLRMATAGNNVALPSSGITMDMRGALIVVGRLEEPGIFRNLQSAQVRGVIAGSMSAALIPAAMESAIPVILTEGFGKIPMNSAIYELFSTNVGREANLNAQSFDRWKGQRPEVIIPLPAVGSADVPPEGIRLVAGRRIRVMREPYAGKVGTVISVPEGVSTLPNGVRAACAEVELGEEGLVRIPLGNLDILE